MEDSPDRRSVRSAYLASAVGTAVWLAAIVLAPWLADRGATSASRALYAVFSPICHQLPDRCFALHGFPLAVCGRCLGIYAGFAAGIALYPWIRGFSRIALPSARVFGLAILPMAVDGLAGVLGIWESPIGARFATGFVWGTVLPFYFVPGIADFVLARRKRLSERDLEKKHGQQ